MASPPILNTTSEGNAEACAISRLATKTSTRKSTTETYMRDEVDSVKLPRFLKFSDAIDIFRDNFDATPTTMQNSLKRSTYERRNLYEVRTPHSKL